MSRRLRLPVGRIESYRKRLDRKLQNLRKQLTAKQITRGQAKDRGTRIIKAHHEELISFIRGYMRRKRINQKFDIDAFSEDVREAVEGWNKIVDDM